MAQAVSGRQSAHDPIFALKLGSYGCFCLWGSTPAPDASELMLKGERSQPSLEQESEFPDVPRALAQASQTAPAKRPESAASVQAASAAPAASTSVVDDIPQQFRKAAAAIDGLKGSGKKLGNSDLLEVYGLYKQATEGDAKGQRPGMGLNFEAQKRRAMWDAWKSREGMKQEEAMQEYCKLADKHAPGWKV